MTDEGILDDIEEIVSDFQKKKPSLEKLSTRDFVKKFVKIDKSLTDFQKKKLSSFKNHDKVIIDWEKYNRENLNNDGGYRNSFEQEYPSELKYNRKFPHICECGTNYVIYINQVETMIERNWYRSDMIPQQNVNIFEKVFFCVKCGIKCYLRMDSNFQIVSIKQEESLQI